jgi:hypothetical protein
MRDVLPHKEAQINYPLPSFFGDGYSKVARRKRKFRGRYWWSLDRCSGGM